MNRQHRHRESRGDVAAIEQRHVHAPPILLVCRGALRWEREITQLHRAADGVAACRKETAVCGRGRLPLRNRRTAEIKTAAMKRCPLDVRSDDDTCRCLDREKAEAAVRQRSLTSTDIGARM